MRTLTAFCPLGLCNRLQVLVSGLVLAEAADRRFTMLWPITPACAAPFADLFVNDWAVRTVDAAVVAHLPYISGWFGHLPDLLASDETELVVGHPSWLLRSHEFPAHVPLLFRCRTLFDELEPIPAIRETVTRFARDHFRAEMIGVHLRRGDLVRYRPDMAGNTAQALAAVDGFLDERPDAGILLCTDDGAVDPTSGRVTHAEGVRELLRRRYGVRVVWLEPRSLDRRERMAIQDALVEFWLLRSTTCFVGTEGSSFSQLAIYGRRVPNVFVGGATPRYRRLEQALQVCGLALLLQALGKKLTKHDLPLPVLLRRYALGPVRRIRRLVVKYI